MINQEFMTQGRMLPNFGICCRDLDGAQSHEFLCMHVEFQLCLEESGSEACVLQHLIEQCFELFIFVVRKICQISKNVYQLFLNLVQSLKIFLPQQHLPPILLKNND